MKKSEYCVGFSFGLKIFFTQSVKEIECHDGYFSCFNKKDVVLLMEKKAFKDVRAKIFQH